MRYFLRHKLDNHILLHDGQRACPVNVDEIKFFKRKLDAIVRASRLWNVIQVKENQEVDEYGNVRDADLP